MAIKKIFQIITFFFGSIIIFSCSDDQNITPGSTEQPVDILITKADLPENTECIMYVFGKSTESDPFLLEDTIHINDGSRTITYKPVEWNKNFYRFLFVALPSDSEDISLENVTDIGNELWRNVRITVNNPADIPADCYYGVIDMTNQQIKNTLLINGEMKRLLGQMTFDIFSIDEEENPRDKENLSISSVLDRVYKIDIDYYNLTNVILFDEVTGEPLWNSTVDVTTSSIDIQLGDSMRMYIEDNPDYLSISGENVMGSVRLRDLYCLPSTDNIKLKATFHYYDTTPICGDISDSHNHYSEDGCFTQKTLVLNLPQNNDEKEYLDILPNYFTVNKAKIREDRIIDLIQSGSYGLNTIWENEK